MRRCERCGELFSVALGTSCGCGMRMTFYNYCVICGRPVGLDDPKAWVHLQSDVRTRDTGLAGSEFIRFHMLCELARQERVRVLAARRVMRRGLRWRRRWRFWRRFLGGQPGSAKGPGLEEL